MGLDSYIFRIKKLRMVNRVYTTSELDSAGYSYEFVENAEKNMHRYDDLLPYMERKMVTAEFYDMEKIKEDYNMTSVYLSSVCWPEIGFSGKDAEGNHVTYTINNAIVQERYTIEKTLEAYIWYKEEEIHYWRNNHELQEWMQADNIQYCVLGVDNIKYINEHFDANIPLEEPDEESALFYYEWY